MFIHMCVYICIRLEHNGLRACPGQLYWNTMALGPLDLTYVILHTKATIHITTKCKTIRCNY